MAYKARRFSTQGAPQSEAEKAAFAAEFPNVAAFSTPPDWTPTSWVNLPIKQQPMYKDAKLTEKVLAKLSSLPPLVHPHEVDVLGEQLARAVRGEVFVIQGGDCAEMFDECTASSIEGKLKILLQMALVIGWGARTPCIKIGRIAGQYAKPRSQPVETLKDGTQVMSFKGEIINGYDTKDREHNPKRLMAGHFHSAATLNYIRAVIAGEFADLHQAQHWDLAHHDEKKQARYEKITKRILEALDFFEAVGINADSTTKSTQLYTSHEGLVLAYESAMTRPANGKHYNLGAHMLWIGNRTRQLDHAHIEYFRGIANPLGVKVGPGMSPEDLVSLVLALNPQRVVGRITLITRYGADNVEEWLPAHIKGIQDAGLDTVVLWLCDCVHGNTYTSKSGFKTRAFDEVLRELHLSFLTHERNGSRLGGCHLEMTGDDVTECVGGPQNLSSEHLKERYVTLCDPRLNYLQSMEMSFLLTDLLRGRNPGGKLRAKM